MDLRQLECFLKVAEHLHFGKAAEELYLGQPTVSEAVRRLERELGGSLFDRTTRRVTLTPLGAIFFDEARDAYRAIEHAYAVGQSAARRQSLELVVGSTGDYGAELVQAIASFHRCAPDVTVTLRSASTARQLRALRERRLNVAVCWAPDADDERFERRALGTSRLAVVVRSDHPLATQTAVSLEDVVSEPLVVWTRASNPRLYDELGYAMDDIGVPWTYVGAASGFQDVVAHVISGFGIGIIIESFAATWSTPGIVVVPIKSDFPALVREVVWRTGDSHPALGEFVEHLSADRVPLSGQAR